MYTQVTGQWTEGDLDLVLLLPVILLEGRSEEVGVWEV